MLWTILVAIHGLAATLVVDVVFRVVRADGLALSDAYLFCIAFIVVAYLLGRVRGGILWVTLPWKSLWPLAVVRRRATWLSWFLFGLLISTSKWSDVAFLFPVFLSLQRATWSRGFQRAFRMLYPLGGARRQFDQTVVFAAAEGAVIGSICGAATGQWAALGGAIGAALGASSMLFEGDSGVPALSVWAQVGGGVFWGVLGWLSPWSLLVAVYWTVRMRAITEKRLRSGEWVDGDAEF